MKFYITNYNVNSAATRENSKLAIDGINTQSVQIIKQDQSESANLCQCQLPIHSTALVQRCHMKR